MEFSFQIPYKTWIVYLKGEDSWEVFTRLTDYENLVANKDIGGIKDVRFKVKSK